MTVLDTDVCIELLRGNARVIEARAETNQAVAVSFLTVGELFYGAAKSRHPVRNRERVDLFLATLPILHSTRPIMAKFGELKAGLEAGGVRLPDADLLIAATAFLAGGSLATGNTDHFSRIAGLTVLNWLR